MGLRHLHIGGVKIDAGLVEIAVAEALHQVVVHQIGVDRAQFALERRDAVSKAF